MTPKIGVTQLSIMNKITFSIEAFVVIMSAMVEEAIKIRVDLLKESNSGNLIFRICPSATIP